MIYCLKLESCFTNSDFNSPWLQGEGHGEDDEGEREDTYEAEDDPDQLKPYKTDLEYLDDHFQLAILKIKVKAVDIRLEMEVCTCTLHGQARTLQHCTSSSRPHPRRVHALFTSSQMK